MIYFSSNINIDNITLETTKHINLQIYDDDERFNELTKLEDTETEPQPWEADVRREYVSYSSVLVTFVLQNHLENISNSFQRTILVPP